MSLNSQLDQLLLEGSSLPSHDPRHAEAARAALAGGPEAIARWNEYLTDAHVLRGAMAKAPMDAALGQRLVRITEETAPPADLQQRLLRLPDEENAHDRMRISPRRWNWKPLAAAAILLLAVGSFTWQFWPRDGAAYPPPPDSVVQTTLLAMKTDGFNVQLAIASADAPAVQKQLQSWMPDMPAEVLPPAKGYALEGGGSIQIDGKAALYTRYADAAAPASKYVVYQFPLTPYGLPKEFGDYHKTESGRRAKMWADVKNGCGWVVVAMGDKLPDVHY